MLRAIRDGVARITFNRPASGNALDLAMAVKFTRALQAVRADDAARRSRPVGHARARCAGDAAV